MSKLADDAYGQWVPIIGSRPQPMGADYAKLIEEDEVWLAPSSRAGLDGSLVLRHEDDHLLLWSIAVAPAARSRNLGNDLLDFTFRRARQLGYREVRLFTNVKMEQNRAWYARKGFRELERRWIGTKHVIFMSFVF